MPFSSANLLLGITGSLGSLAVPSILVACNDYFKEIKVVMTPSSCNFIPPSTIRYLCKDVYTESEKDVSHVALARWADYVVILPATANTIGQAACGLAENLLTQVILAHTKGSYFFPNMNLQMWQKAVVQRNIQTLTEDGHHVYPPNIQECFEQASQSIQKNIIIPSAAQVLEFLLSTTTKGLS